MYQCCCLKKGNSLACMRYVMCQSCCLRKKRKMEKKVLLSYHTASQPPASWKLRATSVPISASDHVMMVSSAHARATHLKAAAEPSKHLWLLTAPCVTSLTLVDVLCLNLMNEQSPCVLLLRNDYKASGIGLLQYRQTSSIGQQCFSWSSKQTLSHAVAVHSRTEQLTFEVGALTLTSMYSTDTCPVPLSSHCPSDVSL